MMVMSNVSDIVFSKIIAIIAKGPSYKYGTKQKDLQFDLQRIKTKIELLYQRANETEKLFKQLEKFFAIKAAKSNILKTLEDHFGAYKRATKELEDSRALYIQTVAKFGNNKVAAKVIKSLIILIKDLEKRKNNYQKKLQKIADKQLPAILDEEENPHLNRFYDLFDKEFINQKKILKKKKIKKYPKWDDFFVDICKTKKKGLKFARFDGITNVPKIDGSIQKKIYVVVTVDITKPKIRKKKIIGFLGDLYVTLTPNKISPSNLPKSYKIKTKKDMESALSFHGAIPEYVPQTTCVTTGRPARRCTGRRCGVSSRGRSSGRFPWWRQQAT